MKGVDFTGMDFTGVNIMELDLSECIITPEQIAQALGRIPSVDELKKILAPKKKKMKSFLKKRRNFMPNAWKKNAKLIMMNKRKILKSENSDC